MLGDIDGDLLGEIDGLAEGLTDGETLALITVVDTLQKLALK